MVPFTTEETKAFLSIWERVSLVDKPEVSFDLLGILGVGDSIKDIADFVDQTTLSLGEWIYPA
jgi:hypothetical protein